jgi:outer membrane protein TolC
MFNTANNNDMKNIILYIILLCSSASLFGQSQIEGYPLGSGNEYTVEKLVPPLAVLIDSALQNSPLLDASRSEVAQIKQDIRMDKKSWTDFLYLEGNGRFGRFDQYTELNQGNINESINGVISETQQVTYFAGISLRLPLSTLTSNHNKTKINNLKIEQTTFNARQIENEIEQLVIEEFYKLKSYEESMYTFQDVTQTLEISYLKAQKDLENGKIEIDEFALLVATRGKAKENYLKARNNFQMQYQKIQVITGFNF